MRRRRPESGFTLPELLIVLVVMGLLATLAVVVEHTSTVTVRVVVEVGFQAVEHQAVAPVEVAHCTGGLAFSV